MALRSIWNGTIRFGQVVIPVGIAPTVKKGGTAFKTLHRPCQTPTTAKKVCPEHGVVPDDELVKGYEVAPGQYVLIEDADLEALTPDGDKAIQIAACVAPREIDPLAVERRYYLTPSPTPIGHRAYLLLRQALADTDTVALARFVAFGSEWLATIAPHQQNTRTLLLSKLSFVDDLVDASEIEKTLAAATAPTAAEAELAAILAEQLRPFRLRKGLLTSDHRERVQQLVEAKLANKPIIRPKPTTGGGAQQQLPGVDLTDALRRSIKKQKPQSQRTPTRGRRPATTRR